MRLLCSPCVICPADIYQSRRRGDYEQILMSMLFPRCVQRLRKHRAVSRPLLKCNTYMRSAELLILTNYVLATTES